MNDDPTARAAHHGWEQLNDAELLSFLLTRGGLPGPAALETARWVLGHVGGLSRLGAAGEGELCQVPGIGPTRAKRLVALATLSLRMAEQPLARGERCDRPEAIYRSLRSRVGRAEQERFLVLLLDARLRKLAEVEVARGRGNSVAVTPREVFGAAVREGAISVVLVHNHPSGDSHPSPDDLELTARLHAAGQLIGIPVNDHLIVTDRGYTSLAAMGHLPVDSRRDDGHNGDPCTPSSSPSISSGEACPTTPMAP